MKPVLYDGRLAFAVVLVALSACTERPPEPRATHEELVRSLEPHLARTGDGLTVERTRLGSRRMPLEGRFRSVHVAVKGPDGKPQVRCVTSKAELDALLAKGAR